MITIADLEKLQYSADGSSWCNICSSSDIQVNSLVLSADGSPWWGHSGGTSETIIGGNIKRILKVEFPYVKTVISIEG